MAKWTICCGMSRSGSTLQYQIIKDLFSINNIGTPIGYLNGKDLLKRIINEKKSEKHFLVKCHDYIKLPEEIDQTCIDYIYSYRDIRDVVVSIMQKENKSFNEVLTPYFSQSLLENQLKIEAIKHLYVSRYNNLTSNLHEEIFRLAIFLQIDFEKKQLEKLATKYSLENQRKKINEIDFENEGIQKYGAKYSKETLFHKNHITSGECGNYKQALTSLEIAIIQKQWKNWLSDHNFPLYKTLYNNNFFLKFGIIITQIKRIGLIHYIKIKVKKYRKKITDFLENIDIKFWESRPEYRIKMLKDDLSIKLFNDSFLSEVIWNNNFENKEQAFIKSYLKEGDVFLDIGANIGLYTLLASKAVGNSGKIFAFEPSPKTFIRLTENVAHNHLTNCILENIALSNVEGEFSIMLSQEGFDAWNSLAKPTMGNLYYEEKVTTKTLDSFIDEAEIKKINFIKIDVEGWEINVLKGASNYLINNDPTILFEVAQDSLINAGFSVKELFEILNSYGFTIFRINENLSLDVEDFKENYLYENLIALK
jgi:FkbM family methyltransferase